MRAFRTIAFPLIALIAASGCVRSFDIAITQVDLVDRYPALDAVGVGGDAVGRLAGAQGAFFRVILSTSTNVIAEAEQSTLPISYSIYPCGRRADFSHHGAVHLVSETSNWHSYAIYIPHKLSQLMYREHSGQIRTGWPAGAITQGLCMDLGGESMAGLGLRSSELRLDLKTLPLE